METTSTANGTSTVHYPAEASYFAAACAVLFVLVGISGATERRQNQTNKQTNKQANKPTNQPTKKYEPKTTTKKEKPFFLLLLLVRSVSQKIQRRPDFLFFFIIIFLFLLICEHCTAFSETFTTASTLSVWN